MTKHVYNVVINLTIGKSKNLKTFSLNSILFSHKVFGKYTVIVLRGLQKDHSINK
jgi:hypothetical protein